MFDAYLQIDGIKGESTEDKHKDWIEVLSFSHSIQQPTSATASSAGGATTGRVDHGDFTITKYIDLASPKLALFCCKGTHIKEITLELCRAGGATKVPYMEYRLSECIISSKRYGGSPGKAEDLPVETVAFNYGKIEWHYTQQKRSDGSAQGKVAAGWDRRSNKEV
jgi:type VI secretion system secreted protein Hcp